METQKDYKQFTIDALKKAGVNIENLRIRYYKESIYQKNRYKKEFVFPEIWISTKDKTKSNHYTFFNFEDFENEQNSKDFFESFIYEAKHLSQF